MSVRGCTGITATWCPRCGDCTCSRDASDVPSLCDDGCPLHAPRSDHGETVSGPFVTTLPVAPTGTSTAIACPGARLIEVPEYPRSAEGSALRTLRCNSALSMGDVARALGLSVVDYSALENGRATLSADEWVTVFVTLATRYRKTHPPVVLDLEGDRG